MTDTPPMTTREKTADLSLNDLLAKAVEYVKAMTPEEREAMFAAQKKAWVAAEMAVGDEGTRIGSAPLRIVDHAELLRLMDMVPRVDQGIAFSNQFPAEAKFEAYGYSALLAHALWTQRSALLSEIAALKGELDVMEVEKIGLRAAIFGSHDYDPSLRHGNFIDMARQTEEARKGALSRATQAERQCDELRKAAETAANLFKLCTEPTMFENASTLNVYAQMTEWLVRNRPLIANQGADQ